MLTTSTVFHRKFYDPIGILDYSHCYDQRWRQPSTSHTDINTSTTNPTSVSYNTPFGIPFPTHDTSCLGLTLPTTHTTFSTPLLSTSVAYPGAAINQAYSQGSANFAVSRLPKLMLPTFGGYPLKWQSFWDWFFAAIDLNPGLTGVQKFNYIKAQLYGDAARTIASLPLTDHNYLHSVALLRERFGQPHKMSNAHMQALLKLPNPKDDLASLHVFYDLIAMHTRGLSSLGKPKHAYGDLLVQIILGKLPSQVICDLTREHGSTAWDIDQIMVAILKQVRILEASSHSNTPCITPEHVTSTAAFHVGSKASHSSKQEQNIKNRKKPCVFCKGPHATAVCDVVCDTEKRYELVKKHNLCFICLAS